MSIQAGSVLELVFILLDHFPLRYNVEFFTAPYRRHSMNFGELGEAGARA